MLTLKLLLGFFFFVLGWVLLFTPNILLSLNRLVRDRIFNDRIILMQRKKLSIFCFCLSMLALYVGVTSLIKTTETQGKQNWVLERNKYTMYLAMQDFCCENYADAIEKYTRILASDPENENALDHIARSYKAVGDPQNAKTHWLRLLQLRPKDARILKEINKIENTKKTK
ncbi:MAG: tetratricopeptide repeat protein [Elusimicrobiota bacterium]